MCRDEVLVKTPPSKKGKVVIAVKPRVREVLSGGGCYAFFCSKHEIKPSKAVEFDTVAREALLDAKFKPAKKSCIEFYGCNRIADWVNRFPAAIRFVREITKGLSGLHYYTVERWSNLKRFSGPFYDSETGAQKIRIIQEALKLGQTRIFRVTGLSGVGKSRLVNEALKINASSESALRAISAAALYINYADTSEAVVNFVTQLADGDYSAIVVVDDCPPDIHDRLVEIVANSQLSLVTLFYQSEPLRQDTSLLTLSPNEMTGVVEQIVRADPYLGSRDESSIKAVADFAQGFPQIAKLITEFRRAPTLEELRDREPLVQKLLSCGNQPDEDTLSTMQALALFRAIGGSAQVLDRQLNIVRDLFCPEISKSKFWRIIQRQKDGEVLQQVADTLMVVPRPLAVALAAKFIEMLPVDTWPATAITLDAEKLLSAFARRLEELEFSDKGEAIGKHLVERGFPFVDAEYLVTGATGARIFRALTVLNPKAATQVATKSLGGCSLATLREETGGRRDLVRALEFACWSPETFDDASRLLLRLAAAENEGWANNATGAFCQLFNLYLSGTQLPAIERLEVIREALEGTDHGIRTVAITALGNGLHYGNFSRMSDTTLGGKRDAQQDWRPSNRQDEVTYWEMCFSLLQQTILGGGDDGVHAKKILANNIGVALQPELIARVDTSFKSLCDFLGNSWPEVKGKIDQTLDIFDDLSQPHRASLERWKSYLVPPSTSYGDRTTSIVSRPGWRHKKDAKGQYVDLSQVGAEEFATEIVVEDVDLVPLLPFLLNGEQQQAFAFGNIIGRDYRQTKAMLNEALAIWETLDHKTRNPSFLGGILRGLGRTNPLRTKILEEVGSNPDLIDLLIPLSASLNLMEADLIRICDAVVQGHLEPFKLRNLIQGQPMRELADAFIIKQFQKLLRVKPESAQQLFEVLFLHCHGEAGKFERFAAFFQKLMLKKGLPILDSHFGWEWQEAAKTLISITEDTAWLVKVTRYIKDSVIKGRSWINSPNLTTVVDALLNKIPVEAWAVFARTLRKGNNLEKYLIAQFLGSVGSKFDDTKSLLWSLPESEFKAWALSNRDLIPVVLDKMSLYTVERGEDEVERFRWHPYARILLEASEDEKAVTSELAGNLASFGSTGSRVPYLEKRLRLVEDLAADHVPKLRRIGKTLKKWLEAEVENTKRWELNEHARYL